MTDADWSDERRGSGGAAAFDQIEAAANALGPVKKFLTYAEAGRIFGRSPRTVRLWVASGHLRAIRIGRARLIPLAEIERLALGDAPAVPASDAPAAAGASKADLNAVDTKNPAPEAGSEAAE